MESREFWLEKRLRELDPDLHKRYTDTVVALHMTLGGYLRVFPEYTDHSEIHALSVIQTCNEILDEDRKYDLNADEIYVLLMGCYLHDIGMGITSTDYLEFIAGKDGYGDLDETASIEEIQKEVRSHHNEFSAAFIRKYARLFDFPSEKHTFAVAQITKGHRKVDLFDEEEYPSSIELDNGNTICLPYLAALVRIADEIDVSANRNPDILFNLLTVTSDHQKMEFSKHDAIRKITTESEAFILHIDCRDEKVYGEVMRLLGKVKATLDYSVSVIEKRTPYSVKQNKIIIQINGERKELTDE